jgi:hypothetical protein
MNVICTTVKLGTQQLRNFVVVPPVGKFEADLQSGRFLLLILSIDSSKSSGRREQADSDRRCGRSVGRNLISSRQQLLLATVSCCLPYGIK